MLRVAEHFEKTDTGRQRRANEDALYARAPVFVVADGMGGAQAGEVASRLAVEAFEGGLPDGGSAEERLADVARAANQRIHGLAAEDAARTGMGTTLTAADVGADGVSFAHVGDSRAYRLRDGALDQLTNDHSLVGELVRRGKLTAEEAEEHPQKSVITRALGVESRVDVDTFTVPARDGDVYLLCSDGLTSMVGEARLAEILRTAPDLAAAGQALVDEANAEGGRDNITVILFRLEEIAGTAPADAALDRPTAVGAAAPTAADVRAALRRQEDAAAEEPPEVVPRAPRAPRPEAPAPKQRRLRRALPVVVTVAVLGMALSAAWLASRAVYFVGTDAQGFVTVYRGLPYDGPFGLELYERYYESAVPAADLPAARRDKLLDHQLRSRSDAADLVRRIERGQLDG